MRNEVVGGSKDLRGACKAKNRSFEKDKRWSTSMQTFIEEYIEIENNPRNHRKRSQLVVQLLSRYPDVAQTSFDDLLIIIDQLKRSQATIRMPLFAQLMYPVLEREIRSQNLQAIHVMLQYTPLLNRYNIMQKIYDGYSERALIKRYLQHEPDDREVLMKNEALLHNALYYALHELPHGVLYGRDSATLDGCKELLDLLEEYKSTCQKLQIDRNADIHSYATHLQGYQDYLLHRHLYKNYVDYIHQHNLDLQKVRNYYYP
jgi:hypothetical protein